MIGVAQMQTVDHSSPERSGQLEEQKLSNPVSAAAENLGWNCIARSRLDKD